MSPKSPSAQKKIHEVSNIGQWERRLLEAANRALTNSNILWGLNVGAAVLADDGKIYEGCNVESCISGLGTCAERCAIDHAVLHGNKKIIEIAVVMSVCQGKEPRPCGACLQYIRDFAQNERLKIVMAKARDGKILPKTVEIRTIGEMLPFPYKHQLPFAPKT